MADFKPACLTTAANDVGGVNTLVTEYFAVNRNRSAGENGRMVMMRCILHKVVAINVLNPDTQPNELKVSPMLSVLVRLCTIGKIISEICAYLLRLVIALYTTFMLFSMPAFEWATHFVGPELPVGQMIRAMCASGFSIAVG